MLRENVSHKVEGAYVLAAHTRRMRRGRQPHRTSLSVRQIQPSLTSLRRQLCFVRMLGSPGQKQKSRSSPLFGAKCWPGHRNAGASDGGDDASQSPGPPYCVFRNFSQLPRHFKADQGPGAPLTCSTMDSTPSLSATKSAASTAMSQGIQSQWQEASMARLAFGSSWPDKTLDLVNPCVCSPVTQS